jgi:hypothetical protein
LTPVSHRITDTRVDLIKMELRQLLWMAFEIDRFCCRDRIPGAETIVIDRVERVPSAN